MFGIVSTERGYRRGVGGESSQAADDREGGFQLPAYLCGSGRHHAAGPDRPADTRAKAEGEEPQRRYFVGRRAFCLPSRLLKYFLFFVFFLQASAEENTSYSPVSEKEKEDPQNGTYIGLTPKVEAQA